MADVEPSTKPAGRAYAPVSKRQQYETLQSALKRERSSFEDHWRLLAEQFLPRRLRFYTSERNKGDRRNQQIIDSTGPFSVRTLASGLHAGLTSPARPWMRLATPDPGLARFGPVQAWLHEVTERMLIVFNLSNLYNALPTVYGDIGVFGTGAIGVLEDPGMPGRAGDLFRCYSYPVGSYWLGLDGRGRATTFSREFRLTVRQVVEQYGLKPNGRDIDWTRISPSVKRLWEKHDTETTVEVCWIVLPAREYDRGAVDARRFPWASIHFEQGDSRHDVCLKEGGFHEFPILLPRWAVTGEDTYGTDSPGMTALGDARGLQVLQRRKAQAIEKMINPPLKGPSSLRHVKVSLLPGDVTIVDERDGQKGLSPIHEVRIGVQELLEDINAHQYRIQRACYEDLFLMIAASDQRLGAERPTAREIVERHEEKLLALGPVLERLNDELHDPLVDRVFGMMVRAGLVPPPPPELEGVELTVEYTSLMAESQKLVGVSALDRFIQSALAMAPVLPGVVHKLDTFAIVNEYAHRLGVKPELVRSDEDAAASSQAQAQAAEAQAEAEQVATLGAGARDLAAAPVTEDNALGRIVQGMGGV